MSSSAVRSTAVVLLLFSHCLLLLPLFVCFCCCAVLCGLSSFAIIPLGKRELVALLLWYSACPDPGIFARRVQVSLTKNSNSVFFLFVFFSPQLILQKSNGQFQRNLSFFQGSRRGPTFSRWGGGSNFFQGGGVQLFPGGPIAYSL